MGVNLLSLNQSTIENDFSTATTNAGFQPSTGVTISRDTSQAWQGSSSLKFQSDGSGTFQSVVCTSPIAAYTPGETITVSGYFKGAVGGEHCNLVVSNNIWSYIGSTTVFNMTTGWQRFSATAALPASFGTINGFGLRFDTGGTSGVAQTFWVDGLQVESGSVATNWSPGQDGTYHAYIAGTLVNVIAGTLHIENAIGQRSQGSMRVWSPLNTAWLYGSRVLVYNQVGALAFAGYTTKDKVSKPGGAMQGSGFLEHDIQLMDNCYRADKRRVFKTYLSTSAGAIVTDLFNTYLAPEGVTVNSSIANGAVINEAIWNGNKSVAEVFTWLATQSGYWWNIDQNGVLWFQPYGAISAPWSLDGTQVDAVTHDLSVEYGNDMFINSEYVKGSFAETGVLTETFKGNGSTRSFTLSYEVARISGKDKATGITLGVTLNGVDITAQSLAKGSSGGQFYFAVGDAVLAQDPGQTILTSSDTLTVVYKGRFPVLANARNNGLIVAQQVREGGGTGLVESTYVNTKVRTLNAAYQIAQALLTHYGADTTVLSFATQSTGLMPGQMLTCTLADFANMTARQMLISDVTISDQGQDGFNIWYEVKAVGSPVESAQYQTFWANLMQQSSDPTDYTDVSNQALALFASSTLNNTVNTFHVSQNKVACPICGFTIGPSVLIC